MSLYSKLIKDFEPEQELMVRKNLSVKENAVVYNLTDINCNTVVFQIDGDVITDHKCCRCDKLILVEDTRTWIAIFVELKGSDIKHALEQIEGTIQNSVFKNTNDTKKYARVLGRRIPKNDSNKDIEKLKDSIRKKGVKLKVISLSQKKSCEERYASLDR